MSGAGPDFENITLEARNYFLRQPAFNNELVNPIRAHMEMLTCVLKGEKIQVDCLEAVVEKSINFEIPFNKQQVNAFRAQIFNWNSQEEHLKLNPANQNEFMEYLLDSFSYAPDTKVLQLNREVFKKALFYEIARRSLR